MKYRSLLLSVLAIAGLTACSRQEHVRAAAKPLQLKTATVSLRPVDEVLEIPARIQPDPARVVRVYPPAGGRLTRVTIRPGDRVRKGQTVALLESSDVFQARADYEKARTESQRSKLAFTRAKLLADHQVISERELQDAQAANEEAGTELERATARLRLLGVAPASSSNEVAVLAPISGIVIDLGASSGELSKSTDNATPICTVADLASVWVLGDVFEKDLAAVRADSPVEITLNAYPGETWNAKVALVSDAIDPQTRSAKIRIVLNNPGLKLKPEMFSTIRVRRHEPDAVVVPNSAILRQGGATATIVQTSPGKYERRAVNIRPLNENESIVLAGLQLGEVVVTEGASLLDGEGEE